MHRERSARRGRARLAARRLGAALAACVVVLVASAAFLALAPPRPLISALASGLAPSGAPGVLFYAETEEPLVALTIDDGPAGEETGVLLDVLAEHGARATFFLIGGRVKGYEDLLERMVAEGHELANHTFRETASIRVAPERLAIDVDATHALLSRYGEVRWLRPGSGFYSASMLETAADLGYRVALGDVWPFDGAVFWTDFHAWYVLHHVRPGSIIVFHDAGGRGRRAAAALRRILPELAARGLRVVTLSTLAEATRRSR